MRSVRGFVYGDTLRAFSQRSIYQLALLALCAAGPLVPQNLCAQSPGPGVITTVAGDGSSVYSGDGGLATAAGIAPIGITLDANGNTYVSDSTNSRVREVNSSTGIISLVAGSGGQNGPGATSTTATMFSLGDPTAVALDTSGHLYIVANPNVGDSGYQQSAVFQVTLSNNTITSYTAPTAQAYNPGGGVGTATPYIGAIAVDSQGDLYESQVYVYFSSSSSTSTPTAQYTSELWKVSSTNQSISRVAGYSEYTGSTGDGGPASGAGLTYVTAIAVDNSGNVFLGDKDVVREISAASGTISTVAGNGSGSYSGDGGQALQAGIGQVSTLAVDTQSHLYFTAAYSSGPGTSSIRQVNLQSGAINAFAGNGSTAFSGDGGQALAAGIGQIGGLAVDGSGDLYLTDASNYRVRIIGAVSAVSRPSVTSLSPSQGVAGTVVTITGSGFGTQQGSSTVSFNGIQATPTSWSATSIVVPVPSGAQTGSLLVTVNNLSEVPAPQFTILQTPQITQIAPNEGGPGGMVTISGVNFGPTQGTSTVDFEGQPAPQITNVQWGNQQITFMIPQAQVNYAINGLVSVVNAAGASNAVAFTILPSGPVVTSILPDPGLIGQQVTIYGSNFGSSVGQSTVTFGGVSATPVSWSSTAIVVTVPTEAATGSVVVDVTSNASPGFLYLISAMCSPPS